MRKLEWVVKPLTDCTELLWSNWQDLFQLYHSHNPMLDLRFVSTLVTFYPAHIYVAFGSVNHQISSIVLLERKSLGQFCNYMPSQSQLALVLLKPGVDFNSHDLNIALGVSEVKLDLFSLDPQEHQGAIEDIQQLQNYAQDIKLKIEGSFCDYWDKRPKRLKKDLARSIKRLNKSGKTLSKVITQSESDIESAIDRYGMLESAGWKGAKGTALHPGNKQGQFYGDLLHRFAKKQQALVFETYFDEELVASRLCIFNNNTLIILKTTYNESYRRYCPGNINRFNLIEFLFKHKFTQFIDFYTSASKEQLYWSTEQRSMYNATCYRNAFIEGLASMAKSAKRLLQLVK